MKKLLIVLLMFIVLSVSVVGATCNSCSDCETKINSASSGEIVTLISDVSDHVGTCITINNSDVIFDGGDNLLDGDNTGSDFGVYVFDGNSDVEIKNLRVTQFDIGIISSGTNNNLNFHDNYIYNNTARGIYIFQGLWDKSIKFLPKINYAM